MKDGIIMTKREHENAPTLYRRFLKHFRSSSIPTTAKRKRFYARDPSKNVQRKDKIVRITRREKLEHDFRMGKISSLNRRHAHRK